MKQIALWPFLIFTLLSAAVSGAAVASAEEQDPPTGVGPVFIDSADILLLESFPVQVVLGITGQLPTPCHEPAWEIQDYGDTIDVKVWSLFDPDVMCTQVLEPFEVSIPLGSYESAQIDVILNGDAIGRIEIGQPATTSENDLVEAGWSFGMCLGYCVANLEITGDQLVATGGGHAPDATLYSNRGTLTANGRQQLDAALRDLGDADLDAVYGCPDCADGGAASLTLVREGKESRHEMQFGEPPASLADLQGLAVAMIDDLAACTPSELLVIEDGCEPPPQS